MRSVFVKDLLTEEKPREKLVKIGAENLTECELISIILGSGTKDKSVIDMSRDLLNKYENISNLTAQEIQELTRNKGVGLSRACSIKVLFEISKRINFLHEKGAKKAVKTPLDAYTVIKPYIMGKNQEHLYLICLDSRGNMISKDLITKGTINETLIHPREIFSKALSRNAVSIILVHNHPSGTADPSDDDIKVTKRIAKAGKEIGIKIVDHIIATNTNYVSLKNLVPDSLKGGD